MECFEQWSGHNLANNDYLVEIYRDCPKVYGSPVFRRHYENPTDPRWLSQEDDFENWE